MVVIGIIVAVVNIVAVILPVRRFCTGLLLLRLRLLRLLRHVGHLRPELLLLLLLLHLIVGVWHLETLSTGGGSQQCMYSRRKLGGVLESGVLKKQL